MNAMLIVLAILASCLSVNNTLPSYHVAFLNEGVPFCQFSSWLQWECGHCGDNIQDNHGIHGNHVTTVRKRALCCSAVYMATVSSCLAECQQPNGADHEVGNCLDVCPTKATTSTAPAAASDFAHQQSVDTSHKWFTQILPSI
ncbi:hypothetical protein DPMN_189803 [Dreissena polymorpha]|uniref:Uncharacterized protein n=1 Tax=Dreissena polymorpha TaxID=45954 RepID=A0A9D4DSL6_DREPO|nr:hypothetical protein DPMN_189803 [Dreissena polymorpha]